MTMYATQAAPQWHEQAACVTADPELFYGPDEGESTWTRRRRVEAAKAVCDGCPVRGECLLEAINTRDAHGVRGGLEPDELRPLLRPQRRPEPPRPAAGTKPVPPDCSNPGSNAQKRHTAFGEPSCAACKARARERDAALRARRRRERAEARQEASA